LTYWNTFIKIALIILLENVVNALFYRIRDTRFKDLASIFKVSRRTIERWFDNWAEIGADSLAISEGRGAKTILKDYSKEVSQQLELHNRNLKNVLIYFEEQHNIKICKKTLQNFLKVTGL
jgi:transposase